jgi:hypothetical protein
MTTNSPTPFEIIAWVETKANSMALRFEPATYTKLLASRTDSQQQIIANIQRANACSWNTALMIYSTSWGAVQLMGFNLYGPVCKYSRSVIEYCDSDADQLESFNSLTNSMGFGGLTTDSFAASAATRLAFAGRYNGAASYADLISSSLQHFGVAVKG